MKLTIIIMNGCPKCIHAKKELEYMTLFPIEWLDISTTKAEELIEKYNLIYAPSFILEDGDETTVTHSLFLIKKKLEGRKVY